MQLNRLELAGFRNYLTFAADFAPGTNVFVGENAQGKTNLLEAIAFLSGGRSHRARSDKDLIGFDQSAALIRGKVDSRNRDFILEAHLTRGQRRKLFSNGVKLKNAGELSEVLQTVLFCPEDLSLIRAGAAERRRFLDSSICQLRPAYAQALAQYQRLLDHKTRILRDWAEKPGLLDILEEFNDGLARTGAVVIHYRAHFIKKLSLSAREIQRDFSGERETLELAYETVKTVTDPLAPPARIYPQLVEHQQSHAQGELAARSCLSGPHKDDLAVWIDGQPARQFASQGQTRTAALSLKLAQREIHRGDTGQWPLLLLDDVLSELDGKRQAFVLGRIQGGQVFITGCEAPVGTGQVRLFRIEKGKLVE